MFFTAAAEVIHQVRLPAFAGVNFVGDIVLSGIVIYGVVPTIERVATVRAPEIIVPATLSSILSVLATWIWCISYTVRRAPRWTK